MTPSPSIERTVNGLRSSTAAHVKGLCDITMARFSWPSLYALSMIALALLVAPFNVLSQGGSPSQCEAWATQIIELHKEKTRIDNLNTEVATTFGTNSRADNYIIPKLMERINERRKQLEELHKEIAEQQQRMFSSFSLTLQSDIQRYNTLAEMINNDTAEIQSRQDMTLRQISLNKSTYSYDRIVGRLVELSSLYKVNDCRREK